MARRTLDFTIVEENRDKGKTFRVTELSASQAEAWAFRAFLALGNVGFDVPENIAQQGLAGLAAIGPDALMKLRWAEAEPLLNEMMSCVQIVEERVVRPLREDDIEEITTRLMLRKQVIMLHLDFSSAAAQSTSSPASA